MSSIKMTNYNNVLLYLGFIFHSCGNSNNVVNQSKLLLSDTFTMIIYSNVSIVHCSYMHCFTWPQDCSKIKCTSTKAMVLWPVCLSAAWNPEQEEAGIENRWRNQSLRSVFIYLSILLTHLLWHISLNVKFLQKQCLFFSTREQPWLHFIQLFIYFC